MNKILVEVSIGELLDKISILEIKKEKIKDTDKLKFINDEYSILNDQFKKNVKTNKINIKLITPETLPSDLVQQQCYLCTDKEIDRPRSVTYCLHY